MHEIKDIVRLGPFGRLMYSSDPGVAVGRMAFRSQLNARQVRRAPQKHRPGFFDKLRGWKLDPISGEWFRDMDLGSGLVTNIGVLALCGDSQWSVTSGPQVNLFKLLKYHATGKGTTSAAISDFRIETDSTVGGQTPVAGTQVFTHDQVGTVQKWQSVATVSYTGNEAVTEWGLFNDSTLSRTTGTPLTAVSANTATVTGTPLTASSTSVQGEQQHVINTGTTARIALITSNTTSVLTLSFGAASGWMVSTTGVIGSTPGSTEAFTLRPVMWDHKVFSAINVINGDSIQWTYILTIASGG